MMHFGSSRQRRAAEEKKASRQQAVSGKAKDKPLVSTVVLSKLFHWSGFFLTVPFGIGSVFANNPEKVKYALENAALPVPRRVLDFCSHFVHLTIVSHEVSAVYFSLALMRDHGILPAWIGGAVPQPSDYIEVHYTVAATLAAFIAAVFWGSVVTDMNLMIPADQLFPAHLNLSRPMKQRLLFQAIFGPTCNHEHCGWQTPFRWFMRYIHTAVPLMVIGDLAIVSHVPRELSFELKVLTGVVSSYLTWNFSCWWLLRAAPYPLQKRIYELGIPRATGCYILLVAFAVAALGNVRMLRTQSGGALLAHLLPWAGLVWMTMGLPPFKARLARYHGVNPKDLTNISPD